MERAYFDTQKRQCDKVYFGAERRHLQLLEHRDTMDSRFENRDTTPKNKLSSEHERSCYKNHVRF